MLFEDKFETWMIEKANELFKDGESITSVCCDLDITRETYYQWRQNKDHPFYETAKKGEQLSQQYWERLGRQGIRGDLEKFAGSSWQFVLKNRFRDHYADEKKEAPAKTVTELWIESVAAQELAKNVKK